MNIDPKQAPAQESPELIELNNKIKRLIDDRDKLNEKVKRMRQNISTLDLTLPNYELEDKIRDKIPPNTYLVKVSTVHAYQFSTLSCAAKKIELIRNKWGVFGFSFWNKCEAFFSASIKTDSIYRYIVNPTLLVDGLLEAETYEATQEKFKEQITAAYLHGLNIEVIVPIDCSDNAIVNIISNSNQILFSMNGGKRLRSFFTKN